MNINKYANESEAIKGSNLAKIAELIKDISIVKKSIDENFLDGPNWESSVKDTLKDDKLKLFKTEYGKIVEEEANLQNFIKYSKELETQIDIYKKNVSDYLNFPKPVNPRSTAIYEKSTEEEKSRLSTEYMRKKGIYDSYKNAIDAAEAEIGLIKIKIANIKFANKINKGIYGGRGGKLNKRIYGGRGGKLNKGIYGGRGGKLNNPSINKSSKTNFNSEYELSYSELVDCPTSELNHIFYEKYEKPVIENIAAINTTLISLRGQADLNSNIMFLNADPKDPKFIAASQAQGLVLEKIKQAETALVQQEGIYNSYKEVNNNGGMFGKDGEIRAISVEIANDKSNSNVGTSEKMKVAVEKFNTNISNNEILPLNEVLRPTVIDEISSQGENHFLNSNIPNSSKKIDVLDLFTRSLYNDSPPDTIMSEISNSNGEITGYKIEDNRYLSGKKEYTFNLEDGEVTF